MNILKSRGGMLILLLLLVGVAGCRSTKKIRKAMAIPSVTHGKDTTKLVVDSQAAPIDYRADSLRFIHATLGGLQANRINFQSFSARMKVHYEGGDGKDYEFNAFIRI